MNRFTSLVDLANGLNNCTDSSNFKAWEKGGKKRIYINNLGHNTKKMSTKVWLELTDKVTAVCVMECPSQPLSWITSHKKEVLEYAERYVRYCRRFFALDMATQPVDVIMHNALLEAEEVTGYYTEWREVRVPINSFGKLALRNRQFIIPFIGSKASAPRTFVPCGPEGWEWLQKQGEFMLDPSAPLPDADERARLYAGWEEKEAARKIQALILSDQQAKEKADQDKVNNEKWHALISNGMDPLKAWKEIGCPHPCAMVVMEAKKTSGLNWKEFEASI